MDKYLARKLKWLRDISGLYYKNITIVNDTFRVIRMMPQLEASFMKVILMTLEVSFLILESSITLLENIYSTGITHDGFKVHAKWF
jgi:hypothetical protein